MDVIIDEVGRPEPPLAAGEVATLTGFLDYQRATLEWKCRGLDAAGLSARVGASSMTLGGLLKHLALVEEGWFNRRLHGNDQLPPGTRSTGTPTPTGNGTAPATTAPKRSSRSGRNRWTGPAHSSTRRWPGAGSTSSPRGRGRAATPRAFGGSWCT